MIILKINNNRDYESMKAEGYYDAQYKAGEKEIYPYTNEQIKMIDKYSRLQETVDIIEQYAEQNFSEEDEMEI